MEGLPHQIKELTAGRGGLQQEGAPKDGRETAAEGSMGESQQRSLLLIVGHSA